MLFEELNHGHL